MTVEQLAIEGIWKPRAADVVIALHDHYANSAISTYRRRSDWVHFDEVRIGTGFGKDAEQRIDFWAMHTLPSQRLRRVAFEVKVSRSDFLAELKQPRKRAVALLWSNEFYFAAPAGLIADAELPPEAGLVEYRRDEFGPRLHPKVDAPWRDTPPASWRFLASLLRRSIGAGEPE
jgi:hypothetical protein